MGASAARSLREYWTRTGHRARLTEAVLPRVASLRGRVLDVGGGRRAGHDIAWTASVRRVRLDLSSLHRPDVIGDAGALPLGDGSFDAVVMFELLEHVPDPGATIVEALRVLAPGGTLLGSAPFVWPIHGDPHDYFRFSGDALRHLLRKFERVEITPLGNAVGGAWVLVSSRSRVARAFNPLLRHLGTRPDPRCPQAHVFMATKARP